MVMKMPTSGRQSLVYLSTGLNSRAASIDRNGFPKICAITVMLTLVGVMTGWLLEPFSGLH
jgi:hypothetical protein